MCVCVYCGKRNTKKCNVYVCLLGVCVCVCVCVCVIMGEWVFKFVVYVRVCLSSYPLFQIFKFGLRLSGGRENHTVSESPTAAVPTDATAL